MKSRIKNITTTDRCERILRFLWQWKIATTATIAKIFFPETSIEACYRRLKRLEKGRFIQIRTWKGATGFVWSLDEEGFGIVSRRFPNGSESGYLSECPIHDLVVLSAHLGDWAHQIPEGWQLCTEQQMRRIPKEFQPEWVPKSKIHRPDGFWYYRNGSGSRLVALEVELSRKSAAEYESTARYYQLDTKVSQVIWVTGPAVNPENIQKRIHKIIGIRSNPHSFVKLDDLIFRHWQSPVYLGNETGQSLKNLLVQKPSESSSPPESSHFFDTRKYPVKSATNLQTKNRHFLCMTGPYLALS